MKRIITLGLAVLVGLFCVNMGTGQYSQNVAGDKVPTFKLKKGRDSFAGMIIDEKTKAQVCKMCFYNPIDQECKDGGDPVGEVYLETFRVDQDAQSKIRLKNITSLEILKIADSKFFVSERHNNRRFIRVNIMFKNESKPKERLVDPQIALGYMESTGEIVTVHLYKIDKITGIKIEAPKPEKLAGA